MNKASGHGAAWALLLPVVVLAQRPICAVAEEISIESQAFARDYSFSRNPDRDTVLWTVLIVAAIVLSTLIARLIGKDGQAG